jgi:hypothetical protein
MGIPALDHLAGLLAIPYISAMATLGPYDPAGGIRWHYTVFAILVQVAAYWVGIAISVWIWSKLKEQK